MLILSRKTNQKILIGDDIELTIIEVKEELYKEIQAENKSATIFSSQPSLPNLDV